MMARAAVPGRFARNRISPLYIAWQKFLRVLQKAATLYRSLELESADESKIEVEENEK